MKTVSNFYNPLFLSFVTLNVNYFLRFENETAELFSGNFYCVGRFLLQTNGVQHPLVYSHSVMIELLLTRFHIPLALTALKCNTVFLVPGISIRHCLRIFVGCLTSEELGSFTVALASALALGSLDRHGFGTCLLCVADGRRGFDSVCLTLPESCELSGVCV